MSRIFHILHGGLDLPGVCHLTTSSANITPMKIDTWEDALDAAEGNIALASQLVDAYVSGLWTAKGKAPKEVAAHAANLYACVPQPHRNDAFLKMIADSAT